MAVDKLYDCAGDKFTRGWTNTIIYRSRASKREREKTRRQIKCINNNIHNIIIDGAVIPNGYDKYKLKVLTQWLETK